MDVENHLYARKDIKQLGIAPMTSMFSCGTNQRRMCHDSSGIMTLIVCPCGGATASGFAVR
ncbi:glucan biosynthesis protein [Escherichia coli]